MSVVTHRFIASGKSHELRSLILQLRKIKDRLKNLSATESRLIDDMIYLSNKELESRGQKAE